MLTVYLVGFFLCPKSICNILSAKAICLIAAQIAQVAKLMLFIWARQLRPSGQQKEIRPNSQGVSFSLKLEMLNCLYYHNMLYVLILVFSPMHTLFTFYCDIRVL